MIDIDRLRENPERIKKATKDKGYNSDVVDEVLRLDKERKELIPKVEKLRAERNEITKKVKSQKSKVKTAIQKSKVKHLQDKAVKIKREIKNIEPRLRKVKRDLNELLSRIPNPPAEDVPIGKDESENKVLRKWGKPKMFSFKVRDHLELGEILDIIDVKRAAKVSGARFGYLKNDAVLLEFALVQLAINVLTKEGFQPIIPPVLTQISVFHKLGYSEHGGNEDYYLVYDPKKQNPEEESNYYLVGTAEHSIIPYYMDEVLNGADLPKRFVGFSTSFRREAGSYGQDTRGILRVHQFDKVEMVSITKPEDGDNEHELLLSLEEKLFQTLGLPYQVVKMCTGDLGAPAARKYDLEAWIPSQNKYREVTSASTTTDFQSRRLNIKYRDKSEVNYVHMLNGTAFAIGRTLIAILENYQQKDGSVIVPEVLQSYVGKKVIKPQ
jgi:seryl-tRNA synthetase